MLRVIFMLKWYCFYCRVADEILHVSRNADGQMNDTGDDSSSFNDWERVINKSHLTVWRKPVPNSYLYEYKGKSMLSLTMCLSEQFCIFLCVAFIR